MPMRRLVPLASERGERTEAANREAAALCLTEPALLDEVVALLAEADLRLAGDCAEVLTMVAQQRPEWVAPHAPVLAPLLGSRNTRVRWEAMHALALVAHLAELDLDRLAGLLRSDVSVIVRDYATEALAASAVGRPAAALPYLKEALLLWDGKHAARALAGLANVARSAPALAPEMWAIARPYTDHGRGVVRTAAKRVLSTD